MKVAVVGSRAVTVENLEAYLPAGVSEIVSGGAVGVDSCAKEYAREKGLLYKEFLPNYARYKRAAPIKRNEQIVQYADRVIAFWDGKSRGTKYTIDFCKSLGKEITVIVVGERARAAL